MKYAIELQHIRVDKKERSILSVDQLQLKNGQVTGVIGPNGAGKSTLLKVMALLEKPTSGTIYLQEKKVWPGSISIEAIRKLAVVFQQPLMLDTTVYKNIAIGLKYRKLSKKVIQERVHYWMEKFGISHLATRRARLLSGGEAQRVALARAMATEPAVLFLDEPFSALDLPTKRKILYDFKEALSQTKTTAVFISHDYQEVNFLCKDVILLFAGTVVEQIPTEMLKDLQTEATVSTFLREWMSPLTTEEFVFENLNKL